MDLCDVTQETGAAEAAVDEEARPELDLPDGVPILRAFYLYMSTSCNLKCRHCWITPTFVNGEPSSGDVIDIELLRKAVAEAKPMGLRSAKLTGGEPLLHPRFREIADMLTTEGLSMDMETNGTLLTADLAKHLKDNTNVSFISVSIDGSDAKTHDAFRGVPGAFEGALRGLDHLVDAGYDNSQVIMCVHEGNYDQIEGLIELAREHGAHSVKINPVTNSGRGVAMYERGEGLDFDRRMKLARYVREELRPNTSMKLILNTPVALKTMKELWDTGGRTGDCGVSHILGLLGTGDIAMCGIGRTIPELAYGKLGEDSIRDIWLNHPGILELRRLLEDHGNYPGICGECAHAKGCRTGCVAQNYVDGRQLVWPSKLCEEAERLGKFPDTRKRNVTVSE